MTVGLDIAVIVLCSIIIFFTGELFARASSNIGDFFKLPRSVKGATFDAMSSSMPELMIAVFSVIAFHKFEVGIGTIVGSALFNLLVIPAACVFVAPAVFKVGREVMHRDGMFYNISVFALLAALLHAQVWTIFIPLIFLAIYAWYLWEIKRHSSHYQKHVHTKECKDIILSKEITIFVGMLAIIAGASYFLTESSIGLAEALAIPPIIIAFTVIAAATSLPDAVISIVNAKKGNVDDAAANVFGSNIFDILIGLSVPVLLAYFLIGPVDMVFKHMEMVVGLLGATILVLYFLAEDHKFSKKQAAIMLGMYVVFVGYAVLLGLNGSA